MGSCNHCKVRVLLDIIEIFQEHLCVLLAFGSLLVLYVDLSPQTLKLFLLTHFYQVIENN